MTRFHVQADGSVLSAHSKLRSNAIEALPALVWFLCVIQPVLDVAAYLLQGRPEFTAFTTGVRLILLTAGFLTAVLVSQRRLVYGIFSVMVALYLTGHIISCLSAPGGYENWREDIADQMRTLVLPVTAVSFMGFFYANPRAFSALISAMVCNLGIILLVEVLSVLTGTDPHTYTAKAIGIRGWFIWTSPQSAILSILSPLVIVWALCRYPSRLFPVVVATLLSFGLLYLYGTRLGYFTLVCVGLGLGVCIFFWEKGGRFQAVAVLLLTIVFAALYPVSPMLKNQQGLAKNQQIRQERMNAAAEAAGHPAGEMFSEDPAVLRAAYRYNLQGMIDRFGLEKVAKRYGDSLDAGLVCDDRVMKKNFCSLLMEEAGQWSLLCRLFGVELQRVRVDDTEVYHFETDEWGCETENFDPENDFNGIMTLNGILGLALLLAFLLWVGLRAVLALRKEPGRFTPTFAAFSSAYGIAWIYAYHTASTLRRNNASVYFAWVLAGLWYLSVCPGNKGDAHE